MAKWGKGISLILSKEPTADFKEVGRQFIAVFKRKHIELKTTQKTTQKTREKILSMIKKNPYITRKELSEKLKKDITEDGVKYHLKQLKQKDLLKRIGPDKGGYWEMIVKP